MNDHTDKSIPKGLLRAFEVDDLELPLLISGPELETLIDHDYTSQPLEPFEPKLKSTPIQATEIDLKAKQNPNSLF